MANRKYEQRERAEKQAETRRRITAATAELHQEVGPAKTTVADVARRAGVSRVTVYNNFPEEYDLVAACQGHWLEEHPLPDLSAALAREDPGERVRAVLRDFYAWYRETERMAVNVRRDRELVPALDRLMSETADRAQDALADALAAGFGRGKRVRATVALALDMWAWRRLARGGLSDRAAADPMGELVGCAAAGR